MLRGFSAIKVRLGYEELETDLEVVRAVRDSVGKAALVVLIPAAVGLLIALLLIALVGAVLLFASQ